MNTYLDSLPIDTHVINLSSYGLTSLPVLSKFVNLQTLYCSNNELTCLYPLPEGLKVLYCNDNHLTSLPSLPKQLTHLVCNNNHMTFLPSLPKQLTHLFCKDNHLTCLPPLPEALILLHCSNNNLTCLPPLPEQLSGLYCENNQLTYLPTLPGKLRELTSCNNHLTSLPPLPEELTSLSCNDNKNLTSLPPFPEQLMELYCCNTNLIVLPELSNNFSCINIENTPLSVLLGIRGVFFDRDTKIFNKKIKTINNFRYLYYSLKFRKQFRKWLWEKIREPKIRMNFHFSVMQKILIDEEAEQDEVDEWIRRTDKY